MKTSNNLTVIIVAVIMALFDIPFGGLHQCQQDIAVNVTLSFFSGYTWVPVNHGHQDSPGDTGSCESQINQFYASHS